jgi:hypothetical protein
MVVCFVVYGCMFCILLFNSVSYVFLLSYLCILIDKYVLFCILFPNWHSPTSLTEDFFFFFFSCKANARVYTVHYKDGARSALFLISELYCSIVLFVSIVFYYIYCLCVNVYCTTATGCQPKCS